MLDVHLRLYGETENSPLYLFPVYEIATLLCEMKMQILKFSLLSKQDVKLRCHMFLSKRIYQKDLSSSEHLL